MTKSIITCFLNCHKNINRKYKFIKKIVSLLIIIYYQNVFFMKSK